MDLWNLFLKSHSVPVYRIICPLSLTTGSLVLSHHLSCLGDSAAFRELCFWKSKPDTAFSLQNPL